MKLYLIFVLFFISFFSNVSANNGNNSGKGEVELPPELTAEISFIEQRYGSPVDITDVGPFGSPVQVGVYGESTNNSFINVNIIVYLRCTSSTCDNNTYVSQEMSENGEGSLTIEDNYGRTITKDFHVWKINKTDPTGYFIYTPDVDTWINYGRTVTLVGEATVFGDEEWNRDWITLNATPSDICYTEGGCTGFLSITDSAGNTLDKYYNIDKIDKTPPNIDIDLALVVEGDIYQLVTVTCTDIGGSECTIPEKTFMLPLGIASNKCVYDNAGNYTCWPFETAVSYLEYTDSSLDWTSGNRTIFLDCQDEIGGSGCAQHSFTDNISSNVLDVGLDILDRAGNKLTKHFQISKIDKVAPTITISGLYTFKANDQKKINITAADDLSGINDIKYNWDTSCTDGTVISGIDIINNTWINQTESGDHILYVCTIDNAGNIYELTKDIKVYPGDLDDSTSSIEVLSKGDKFANNSNFYSYTLTLKDKYGNTIYNKTISSLDNILTASDDRIFTSMITPNSGGIATSLACNDYKAYNDGKIYFTIKSLTPGTFTEKFNIRIPNWGNNYTENSSFTSISLFEKSSNTNTFKQPISGNISVIEGGSTPEIGKEQKYKIGLTNEGNLTSYSDGKLNISDLTIKNSTIGHYWNTFNLNNNYFSNDISTYLGFSGIIDANSNILDKIQLKTDNLVISYNLGGKDIEYYLNDFGANGCNVSTLGLKVIGTLQGDGKSDITGQETNFSDMSKGKLKSKIRSNAYRLIKGLSSGDIVNGIKYIEGNYTISGDNLGFESLIVKDGNVIIDGDLNTLNNKLGIIILKDNYLIESDYDNFGNIYVNKDVTEINAIIYADGAFRSTDLDGNSYNDSYLDKKLILNGSLFTRNTIGGAVKANIEWVLPGGKETDNFKLAEIYDLNYIRKFDNSCDIDNDYSFLIKYNSSIQTNPPKGFDIK